MEYADCLFEGHNYFVSMQALHINLADMAESPTSPSLA